LIKDILGHSDEFSGGTAWVSLPGPAEWWTDFPDNVLNHSNELIRKMGKGPSPEEYNRGLRWLLQAPPKKAGPRLTRLYGLLRRGSLVRENMLIDENDEELQLEELAAKPITK